MKICKHCGSFPRFNQPRTFENPDIKRLISIMERNHLMPKDLQELLGVSKRTVMRWMNSQAKIKNLYFEILLLKGYI